MREKATAKPRRNRLALLAIGAAVLISTALITGAAGPTAGQAFAQSRTSHATTETCAQSKATVETLRTMDRSQLEQVFKTLAANPPIPNGFGQGYAWIDASAPPITVQNLVRKLWQGKDLYDLLLTHIVTDVFLDTSVAPGVAHYTTSSIDGRGALEFDWTAYSPYYDEVRMIAPGVYVGFAFTEQSALGTGLASLIPVLLSVLAGADITPDYPVQANVPYANVILDFNCPNTWWAS
jgi:hypothetical protein